jgi:hypothetical protein
MAIAPRASACRAFAVVAWKGAGLRSERVTLLSRYFEIGGSRTLEVQGTQPEAPQKAQTCTGRSRRRFLVCLYAPASEAKTAPVPSFTEDLVVVRR